MGRAVWLLMIMSLCVGCVDSRSRAYVTDIEGGLWSDVAIVEIDNRDTTSLNHLSIFLKHQPYEALEPLPVEIYTVTPDEVTHSDRVTLTFEGCARGESVMAHQHTAAYRRDVVLRQAGIYRLYIFPSRPTRGIEGVGVSITQQ